MLAATRAVVTLELASVDQTFTELNGYPNLVQFSRLGSELLISLLALVEVVQEPTGGDFKVTFPGAGCEGYGRTEKAALSDLRTEIEVQLALGTFCELPFLSSANQDYEAADNGSLRLLGLDFRLATP